MRHNSQELFFKCVKIFALNVQLYATNCFFIEYQSNACCHQVKGNVKIDCLAHLQMLNLQESKKCDTVIFVLTMLIQMNMTGTDGITDVSQKSKQVEEGVKRNNTPEWV